MKISSRILLLQLLFTRSAISSAYTTPITFLPSTLLQRTSPHPFITKLAMSSSTTNHEISKLRKEYSQEGIDESTICPDPIDMFTRWFSEAKDSKVLEPNAMCLATCSKTGFPSARYVLLKGYDHRGFVWYTNYKSRKGSDLEENPRAAVVFWWGELGRSIRIEGEVQKVSEEESEGYFYSRPVNARLGAVGSDQSEVVGSREKLDRKFETLTREYLDENGGEQKKVERPKHWGGYRLMPKAMEFWKGRESRVHDRIKYTLQEDIGAGKWAIKRLQP